MTLAARNYCQWIALFPTFSEAVAFEQDCLAAPEAELPEYARLVKRNEAAPTFANPPPESYWQWLADQLTRRRSDEHICKLRQALGKHVAACEWCAWRRQLTDQTTKEQTP